MPTRKAKPERDVTKAYPLSQFADKLRRLADAVEGGQRFRIPAPKPFWPQRP